ncbi:MAG: hypothetical protein IPL32_10845 [Chloracidobacterium sp.]|nr:hypothetical protein [Chloracidobacterium sp.]
MTVMSFLFRHRWLLISSSNVLILSCTLSNSQSRNYELVSNNENPTIYDQPVTRWTPPVDYATQCNEFEEDENYSLKSIRNNLTESDVVVHAEVLMVRPDSNERGYRPYTFTAKVIESFKGELEGGKTVEFSYVLEVDKEPDESSFLGERVLWLHRYTHNGETRYGQIEFMAAEIHCNVLEKIRRASKKKYSESK